MSSGFLWVSSLVEPGSHNVAAAGRGEMAHCRWAEGGWEAIAWDTVEREPGVWSAALRVACHEVGQGVSPVQAPVFLTWAVLRNWCRLWAVFAGTEGGF